MQCGHCQKLIDTIDEIVKQAVVEAALVFLPKF
jgi:thiol-disulfide isomerase/thioredoxin